MANSIAYAQLFQQILDEQIAQESVTSWMNAQNVIYNGGKTIKLPKMTLTGLGDYSRSSGYAQGAVTLEYETLTMTCDRGAQFLIDSMDVDETNFVANATAIMTEFQRTQVIPEIDAYRLSAIATAAMAATDDDANVEYGYTVASATIMSKLINALKIGDENAVIYMTPDALAALETAVGANNISSMTFSQGGFDVRVPSFSGRPIIKTDASRMVTAIDLLDLNISATPAQNGGWAKDADALDINFMVVPRNVPIAVDKLDEPKIFEPSQVQNYSGWLIDYRRYHDCFVADNKAASVFVNIKDAKPSGTTGQTAQAGGQ